MCPVRGKAGLHPDLRFLPITLYTNRDYSKKSTRFTENTAEFLCLLFVVIIHLLKLKKSF